MRRGGRRGLSSPLGEVVAKRPEGGRGHRARPHSSHAGAGTPTPSPPLKGEGRSGSASNKHRIGPADALQTNLVLLGEFGRAHGLRGELRVKSYTADPLAIGTYGPLTAEDGRQFALKDLRQAAGDQPDLLIARVEGVATREAAEALNRLRLLVPRERLGDAEEEDEFLLADLVGLSAEDVSGAILGTVAAVPNYGGGDLLEIALPGTRRTVLIPFTKAFVPNVDIAAGKVVVAAPELFAEPEREPGRPGEEGVG